MTVPLLKLESLDLSQNKLNLAAAKQLAKGNWPLLSYLTLHDNYLDDAAMFHLSHGHWPHLHALRLEQNKISATGIQLLVQAEWHWLCRLSFDIRAVSSETWKVLQLDPDCMPDLANLRYGPVTAKRRVSGQNGIWQFLDEVAFYVYLSSVRKDGSRKRSRLHGGGL